MSLLALSRGRRSLWTFRSGARSHFLPRSLHTCTPLTVRAGRLSTTTSAWRRSPSLSQLFPQNRPVVLPIHAGLRTGEFTFSTTFSRLYSTRREDPLPEFVRQREAIWDELYLKHHEETEARREQALLEKNFITISLPDIGEGHTVDDAIAGVTTPFDLASSTPFAEAHMAEVDGVLWDMARAIPSDSSVVRWLNFGGDVKAESAFWHSSAHVLGASLESYYGAARVSATSSAVSTTSPPPLPNSAEVLLCDGPPLSSDGGGGFYYEFTLPGGRNTVEGDLAPLEKVMSSFAKKKHAFERMTVTRDEALRVFEYNPYKAHVIGRLPESDPITLYRCGHFIDLCRGPHIRHTGQLKAVQLTKASAMDHVTTDKADMGLRQRVYGVTFPSKLEMKEWKHLQEEAKKRDHRLIGARQKLISFHTYSPGSPFFLPHGTRVYNSLVEFLREEYRARGYDEVITPQIFSRELWEKSGHWSQYAENMYQVLPASMAPLPPPSPAAVAAASSSSAAEPGLVSSVDTDEAHDEMPSCCPTHDEQIGLKPMNCPGHCLVFASETRSYRHLPMRLAEFGGLHRNELAGALGGLTRVRRFTQDDAHIFCRENQIREEVDECLQFISFVYSKFGFEFSLLLSTQPEKSIGDQQLWATAEQSLRESLDASGMAWKVNEGDGAFYGPKIDIVVKDALRRRHQVGTIQLDFVLPRRFDLKYIAEDGNAAHPVMIHRAVLGSMERFMALLIEHAAGWWPFWLSPRQCMVCSVSEVSADYAQSITAKLKRKGLYADADLSDKKLPKKIRDAQAIGYNYMLIVGEKEQADGTVNVRTRDGTVHGTKPVADVLLDLVRLKEEKTMDDERFAPARAPDVVKAK